MDDVRSCSVLRRTEQCAYIHQHLQSLAVKPRKSDRKVFGQLGFFAARRLDIATFQITYQMKVGQANWYRHCLKASIPTPFRF